MRSHFQIPDGLIYLNSGTMSYSPKSVIQAVANAKEKLELNPAQGFLDAWELIGNAHRDLAQFIKAKPTDLYLRANITYVMNDFLMALQLPKNSTILISDLEYGAIVNIIKNKAEQEGHLVEVLKVPQRGNKGEALTEREFLKSFEDHLTSKTKLAMFSHVTSGTGFVFPIEKMAEICRSKGIIFAVDGAHGIGTQPLDFSKTKVDFYGSNLHKWFMGPKGTGFGWVSPGIREKLVPQFAGWTTFETPSPFSNFGRAIGAKDRFADRWMLCSSLNFSDVQGISSAVQFWNENGAEKIMSQQQKLVKHLSIEVEKLTGWKRLGPADSSFHGPMVAFDIPETLQVMQSGLMSFLKANHQIQALATSVQDRWCLRLAPNIYNTESEINSAAELLSTL